MTDPEPIPSKKKKKKKKKKRRWSRWWSSCVPVSCWGPLTGTTEDAIAVNIKVNGLAGKGSLSWQRFLKMKKTSSGSTGATTVVSEMKEEESKKRRSGTEEAESKSTGKMEHAVRLLRGLVSKASERTRRIRKESTSKQQDDTKRRISFTSRSERRQISPTTHADTCPAPESSSSIKTKLDRASKGCRRPLHSSPATILIPTSIPSIVSIPSTPRQQPLKPASVTKDEGLEKKSNSTQGLSVLMVALVTLQLGGRTFAIVVTVALLYLINLPLRVVSPPTDSPRERKETTKTDHGSREDKRRVVMEGFLNRSGKRRGMS